MTLSTMRMRKGLEYVISVVVTASFGLIFVTSYFLFSYVATALRRQLGRGGELAVDWILFALVAALLTTILFNFWLSDILQAKLHGYLTGER